MHAWSHHRFTFPLPPGHRYPLHKYGRLAERVLADGTVAPADLHEPDAVAWEDVLRVHDAEWIDRLRRGDLSTRERRAIGLPWSRELLERSRRGTQGTVEAARAALRDGTAMMLGAGTHHAFRASARGYCLVNDLAVATDVLRRDGRARRVMVVDCDVHQGDGTADHLRDDPEAFALSIHGGRNYPFQRTPGDLDVALPDGTGDEDYLVALELALGQALDRFVPELVIYVAGADPWVDDRLGRLALSKAGLRARDELVVGMLLEERGIPVAGTLAGGYPKDLEDGVDINAATVAVMAAARG